MKARKPGRQHKERKETRQAECMYVQWEIKRKEGKEQQDGEGGKGGKKGKREKGVHINAVKCTFEECNFLHTRMLTTISVCIFN